MKWISVNKKLPKGTERVLVTLKNKCVFEMFYINNKFMFIENLQVGGMREAPEYNPVVAWQPLPKPYKQSKEG